MELTIDKITEAAKALEDCHPNPFASSRPFSLYGVPVFEVKPKIVPKIQIREDFEWIADEGREKLNKQLIDLFGYKDDGPIKANEMFITKYGIVARPEAVACIKNITA